MNEPLLQIKRTARYTVRPSGGRRGLRGVTSQLASAPPKALPHAT